MDIDRWTHRLPVHMSHIAPAGPARCYMQGNNVAANQSGASNPELTSSQGPNGYRLNTSSSGIVSCNHLTQALCCGKTLADSDLRAGEALVRRYGLTPRRDRRSCQKNWNLCDGACNVESQVLSEDRLWPGRHPGSTLFLENLEGPGDYGTLRPHRANSQT